MPYLPLFLDVRCANAATRAHEGTISSGRSRDAGRRSRLSLPLGFHPRFLPPRPIAVLISPPSLPALPPHPPLARRYLKALRLQAEVASSSAGAKRPADELGADGQPVKRPRGRPKGSKNSKPKTKPGTPTGSGSAAPNP